MKFRSIINTALAVLMVLFLTACDEYSSSYIESCDYSCTASTSVDACSRGCDYSYGAGKVVPVTQIGHLYPREVASSSVPLTAPPAIGVAETPPETAIGTAYSIEKAVVVAVKKLPIAETPPVVALLEPSTAMDDPCVDAPVFTRKQVFTVTEPRKLWEHSGADQVRGAETEPYLKLLRFTREERKYFLAAIAKGEGTLGTLENGTEIGWMTSRSGRIMRNAVVAFDPIPQTGEDHYRDDRVRTYVYEHHVILDGMCVKRVVKLIEPFVCGNWSRPSDEIIPVMTRPAVRVKEEE